MPTTTARPAHAELPASAGRLIGRFFFGTNVGAALASAAIVAAMPAAMAPGIRFGLIVGMLLFAVCSALAMRFSTSERFPMNAALSALALAGIVLAGLVSLAVNEGLRSPPLAFFGLIVCVVGSITGVRHAIGLGVAAWAMLLALAWVDTTGGFGGVPSTRPWLMPLLFHSLIVLCGAVGGVLISRVLDHYLRTASEREQRFRGLLSIAADWYWEQGRDFRFIEMSEVGAPGVARPRALSRAPWQLTDMGLSADQLDAHRAELEARRPFSALRARRRDAQGRWCTVSLSGQPRFDANGVFTGYWGVARDVTDEVRTQRAVTASETRYRELFTRSPSPLFLHRRGIVFDANEAAAQLFGFENAAAMNGFAIMQLFQAGAMRDHAIERMAHLERKPAGEALPVSDFQLVGIDGQPLHVQATGVRVDTSSGPAILSIFFDITARQATEAALRRSEAMLSHLFATSPDCIALTEMATGRYAMVNPAFCRVTGYAVDEVVGRNPAELGVWQDAATRDRLLALLERDGTVADMPAVFVTKSGAPVSMLLAAGRFAMDRRDYLVLNARDVTESERTRMQHTAILERASIGIAFTRNNRFVEANPFFERMFGWEPGALRGQPGSVVWAAEADYLAMGEAAGPLLAAGQPFAMERRMLRHDGSPFWCRLLAQAVDLNDPRQGGTIWITEDVTERRRLDEALATARDAAEAASQAKSSFLANTSHEIRTPLNGLLGLARLAMQRDLPEARRDEYLAQILDSAQSLAGIMSDVLDVSKIEAGKITLEDTPFDLRELLEAVHHAYESLAEVKGLELQLAIDERLPATVRGDPVRVRQILSNFITNALKFTERGTVRMEATQIDGGGLRFTVSDTGPGVPLETQARLFSPFSQGDSSTTRRFGGTGLGLSICRELAQLMGGTVGMQSTPGNGSTFWAELPLPSAAPALRSASTEASDLARLHGARVLLAEDNPVNMLIAVAMLERWGMRVEQAIDGHAAIEAVHAAAREGLPFDAVVMDVQMPVMGGHEAARELRRHYSRGHLPILALTAAALVSERDEALDAGMDAFLTKPIDAGKLRHALAGLMQRDA